MEPIKGLPCLKCLFNVKHSQEMCTPNFFSFLQLYKIGLRIFIEKRGNLKFVEAPKTGAVDFGESPSSLGLTGTPVSFPHLLSTVALFCAYVNES